MATRTSARNVCDPRVRELIRATGDPDLFPEPPVAGSRVCPAGGAWPLARDVEP